MKQYLLAVLILSISLFFNLECFSQEEDFLIEGQVFDKRTGITLPFVNIIYESSKNIGTITDIDGRFVIKSDKNIYSIELSYLGYQKKSVLINSTKQTLKIYLAPERFTLSTVEVFPTENPAHRIVKNAIDNRGNNKPEALSAYKYETYNKMYFTFDVEFRRGKDTVSLDNYVFGDTLSRKDSVVKEMSSVRNNQYLFLMESVSEKKYKKPGKINEKVLATKVSGIKNPTFALIGTQMQSFTIYSNYITIGEKRYLSPLSKNSTSNYLFIITDTIVHSSTDTTYTLSYQPRKNKRFEGLTGVLQINTKGFAVENFSTKPIKQSSYTITIRQKYEFLKDSAWFPTQLDADFIFPDILVEASNKESKNNDNLILYGKVKTYIKNVDLLPQIPNRDFSYVAYQVGNEAGEQGEDFWNQYRVDSISVKEKKTYQVIDSLGQKFGFEKIIKYLSYLVNGKVPISFVSLQLDKLINISVAEGFRLGLGIETNDKISKLFKLDGYGAYGFVDKRWKYGGGVTFNIRDSYDSHFNIKYQDDVIEVGAIPYVQNKSFLNALSYREYLVKNVVYEKSFSASLEMRFLYYLKACLYAQISKQRIYKDTYEMQIRNRFYSQFNIPEIGIGLRYAFREYFIKTQLGVSPLKTDYPVVYFNIAKSLSLKEYSLDYTKIWSKIEKDFLIRNGAVVSVNFQTGYAWGDLPYYKLFNGQGSYYPITILVNNSFGTMGFNEFTSDKFAYLFLRYNFGAIFYETSWSKPKLSILHNMGWSDCSHPEYHLGIPIKTMSKGYYESGFSIDNLIKWDYSFYGLGVYYRYGPYAFQKPIHNFAFKLSITFTL